VSAPERAGVAGVPARESGGPAGFVAEPYPYDRLGELHALAGAVAGGAVDLSIGTPCDPPPASVVEALGRARGLPGYPSSVGSSEAREAAVRWMARRFEVALDPAAVALCVGTKELVATVPWLLRLRRPDRDLVLCPAVAYPTYAMGARLAGCQAVPVPQDAAGAPDWGALPTEVLARALLIWVNSPANPTGALVDLQAAADFARRAGVPLFSDECYVELTWQGPPRTVLETGTAGVVAVHSLSKRSNLAGLRVGCYAGDPALVQELAELRRHLGLMVPGPAQDAAVAAWEDDQHAQEQRSRYRQRLERLAGALASAGLPVSLPAGGFYLWVPAPEAAGRDGWALARTLAAVAGIVASPGDLYGEPEARHVRLAVVVPDEQLEVAARRLEAAGSDRLTTALAQAAQR